MEINLEKLDSVAYRVLKHKHSPSVLAVFNSVQLLMSTVASVTGIPEDKQVLLISSGEALDPSERVCSYSSAGTVSKLQFSGVTVSLF